MCTDNACEHCIDANRTGCTAGQCNPGGGETFCFCDRKFLACPVYFIECTDAERLVTPRAGRLVAFSSGLENLHRVREVTRGERFVLAMWFTCSAEHAYNDFAAADAEDGGGDALAAPDGPGRWASGLRDGVRPEL